jgi:hypothetical protein
VPSIYSNISQSTASMRAALPRRLASDQICMCCAHLGHLFLDLDLHLAPHGFEVGSVLGLNHSGTLCLMIDRLKINIFRHVIQEFGHLKWSVGLSSWASLRLDQSYRLCMPSTAAWLEKGEVATERCGQADSVRVLFELLVGYSLLHSNLLSCQ